MFQGPEARYTFANFVVGKPNEFAYAAARNIAEQDRPLPERNPLYIFGGVGLGKTHLMHAIWHVIRERDPKTRGALLTAESFVNRFIQALRTKNTEPVQGVVPQRRRADGRRRAVHLRQGSEPGRVLLHVQFAGRAEQADRAVVGKAASELQDIEERMRPASARAWSPTSIRRPTNCGFPSCRPRPKARACPCRWRCSSSWRTRSTPTSASSKARSTGWLPTAS
jgi:chromosomal replication initiator protein